MNKFRQQLNIYFQKTTLHGFAYISNSQTWTERVFWILALLSSLICCVFLVYELTVKVLTNPIIIQQPDKPIPIKNIPFPAFSFCATSLVNDSYDIYSSLLVNNSVTYPPYLSKWYKTATNWKDLHNYIQNRVSFRGVWIMKYRTKPDFVISPFGWCQVFNTFEYDKMFHINVTAEYFKFQSISFKSRMDESIEFEKVNNTKQKKQFTPEAPLYTVSKTRGLFMASLLELGHYPVKAGHPMDTSLARTFTLFIHSPFELPDLRHKHFVAKHYQTYILTLSAEIKTTHETLLDLDVDERRCYKKGEKELKVFRTYTPINCLRECESSFMLNKCKCVPYYFIVNDLSLICSKSQMKNCFEPEYSKFDEARCRCYSSCEELSFGLDIQMTEFSYVDEYRFINRVENLVTAFFKDDSFYPQIRRKYFTTIDWFSFVGGILGLFFGFSFLSGIEMIFHIFLGIFGNAEIVDGQGNRTTQLTKFVDYLKSFMDNSSIHSFSYISDNTTRIFERIGWLISFILSITACSLMIIELRQRLSIDSISIISSDIMVNLTQYPFPAATLVYPRNPIYYNPSKQTPKLNLIHTIANFLVNRGERQNYYNDKILKNDTAYYGHEIVPFIRKQTSLHPSYLPWMAWNEDNPVLGQMIITSRGLVFNFNMVSCEEMFFKENVSKNFYYKPKLFGNGPKNKSEIPVPWYPVHGIEEKITFVRNRPRNGHYLHPMIYFHSPFEYPFEFIDQYDDRVVLKYKNILDLFITPEIITTDEDLKALPPDQRMCYLENERKLKYFRIYTERNCQIECLSEVLLRICGCVPFDIIRGEDTKVCEIKDDECVETTRRDFTYDDDSCSCLQPCDFFRYNYDFVQSKHRANNETSFDTKYEEQLDTTKGLLGFLTVKFKEKEFSTKQRVRTFTIVDFLSYIGGLLGLFAGISVLSLFEIFYFFTLRVICEIFKALRNKLRVANIKIVLVAPKNQST